MFQGIIMVCSLMTGECDTPKAYEEAQFSSREECEFVMENADMLLELQYPTLTFFWECVYTNDA